MKFDLNIRKIEARDLPDLWFLALREVLNHGRQFVIDKGSYAGQTRLEFDYFMGHVKFPGTRPILPDIPPSFGIPNPVEEAYIYGGEGYTRSYIEYLMTPTMEPNEAYTYGSRLTAAQIHEPGFIIRDNEEIFQKLEKPESEDENTIYFGKSVIFDKSNPQSRHKHRWFLNQIEWVIDAYKKYGHRNNQLVLQVAQPSDLTLIDPPCLRSIDTRIQDNKLHFFVYFRSWDLWGGLPANLAGIQNLKEYMANAIGVEDGEMIVESKGLHLYGYAEKFAKIRCMVE